MKEKKAGNLWNQLDAQRRKDLADGMADWGSILTEGWDRIGSFNNTVYAKIKLT